MSEERFTINLEYECIDDAEERIFIDFNDRIDFYELCAFLNEQQATINKQDEEIKKLKRTERSWRKIHCCNKESDNCGIVSNQESKIKLLEKENEDLREVNKENQRLHEENVKQCERWRTLYELKDREVTARVKRLNEICNQYKHTITFDKDIDPNDAVNILCDRILQTEVEM